ncbi:MAG: glycosyltransferase [Elusimicrobia bacterium]|nr:glycosyltransferase [Elusimicrobiota bacterium]
MRILQVGKYTQDKPGGVETAVYTLCRELAKEHDVELLAASPSREGRTRAEGRFTEHVLPTWLTAASTPLVPALVSRLRAARGFDVVQVSLQNPMAVLAVLLARPAGRLVAWYHHDIVRQKRLGRAFAPLQAAFLRRADAIVATSREYAEGSEALRAFVDKIHVIELGVDAGSLGLEGAEEPARRLRARFGGPLIVFVGRLVYYKGLGCLLEAMRGLDARLLVVGSGPLEAELRAAAARPGLAGRVFFEAVPHDRPLGPYWLAADAAVLPSTERTEAFGLSLVEAMHCGKPVVATRLGTGTTTVCRDGVNGLVVEPGDPAGLRAALARLLADPALSRRLGEAGRALARERFSAEAMARSFVELYGRLAARPC